MPRITPCLWFDSNAEEAVKLYTSLFEDSSVGTMNRYNDEAAAASGRPKGSVMTITFQLCGQDFMALNGGPIFKFSPAISFFVSCASAEELDHLWTHLSRDGTVLMELGQYPFSKRFGWVQDQFGVSWQLNLSGSKQRIAPFLTFVGIQHGQADNAIRNLTAIFNPASVISIGRYGADDGEPEGTVKHADFVLDGREFMAMESAREHTFTFTPAISFIVNCSNQHEVDDFWNRLSDGGKEGQCGWLEDKFGLSWQIVPTGLATLVSGNDPEKSKRVMAALLRMRKIQISELEQAHEEAV